MLNRGLCLGKGAVVDADVPSSRDRPAHTGLTVDGLAPGGQSRTRSHRTPSTATRAQRDRALTVVVLARSDVNVLAGDDVLSDAEGDRHPELTRPCHAALVGYVHEQGPIGDLGVPGRRAACLNPGREFGRHGVA